MQQIRQLLKISIPHTFTRFNCPSGNTGLTIAHRAEYVPHGGPIIILDVPVVALM
jgi:hypothetical protein